MYKISVQNLIGNETIIYYPGNRDYTVSSAVLTYEVGLAGEFNFVIPVTNPAYNLIVRNAIITVYEDNKEIWRGDIRDIKTNFDKSLSVYAVEDLAWLGEEPVAMVSVSQTYGQRFSAAITTYNNNQATKRQFSVGQLTAQSSSGLCTWQPEYGDSVLSGLRTFIAKDKGYLKVRRAYSGDTLTRYIDIVTLADYGKQSTQKVEFGSNLIDFVKDMDVTNLCNALYPYGDETDTELYGEVMQRIAGTPIQNNDSISAYGRRAKTVVFDTDDTTTLNNLASAYLSRYSQPNLTLEIKAADLGSISSVDTFAIGDAVRVVAGVYAVDQWMYITKMDVDLLDAAQNQITLSDEVRNVSLTSRVAEQAKELDDMRSPLSILDEAKANALQMLEGTDGGIITFVVNSDGQITEQRILNNLDYDQATKAWRWTLGGLAYMHRDYPTDDWTVGVAINMNGEIVADYITTGSLNADRIAGGTLTIGGTSYSSKSIVQVLDSSDNTQIVKLDKDGLMVSKGTIQSSNYSYTSGRYSTAGMMIDLLNGVVRSKNFAITSNGNVYIASGASIGGYATESSLSAGTTTINGGCLSTGTINANNVSITNLSASSITSGTLASINYEYRSSDFPFAYTGTKIDLATGEFQSRTLYTSGLYDADDHDIYCRGIKCGTPGDFFSEDNYIWALTYTNVFDPAIRISYDEIAKKSYGTWYYADFSVSDRKFKEDIEPLDTELSIEFIDKTEPKEFKFKGAEGRHYGMIAQEVRELLDELGEDDSKLEFTHEEKNDEHHDIHYHEYIPHLINYVKDLRAEINSLKDTINKLKEER